MNIRIKRVEGILMINVNESAENIQIVPNIQNCRICLEPCQQFADTNCQCRGNNQYIHKSCLLEWAKRTDKFLTKNNNIYFLCDICKAKIFLEVERVCTCKQKKQICSLKVISPTQAFILVCVGLIFMAIAGICFYFLLQSGELDTSLLVISVSSLSVSLISFSILFIKQIFICRVKIVGISSLVEEASNYRIANSFTQQNL